MPEPQTSSDSSLPDGEICPHLGIEEDPQTCLGYASLWNCCHRAKPISVVGLSQQRKMCLSSAHADCPVFKSEELAPLPVQMRHRQNITE